MSIDGSGYLRLIQWNAGVHSGITPSRSKVAPGGYMSWLPYAETGHAQHTR